MAPETNPDYSIVVPVYNSSATLDELYRRITDTMKAAGVSYEIVMIDDGSSDGSWEIMERLHEGDGRVRIIQLRKNAGQHRALMCGFHNVRGRFVINMDDDLQHPPEEIPKLIAALNDHPGMDVVFGRPEEKKHSPFRNMISACYNIINSYILEKSREIRITPFRIIRREIVDEAVRFNRYSPTIGTILVKITPRVMNVTVDHHPRRVGKSTYSLGRLIVFSLDIILHNSTLPLKAVSVFGMILSAFSILFGMFNIVKKLAFGVSAPGWTSLIVVNLFHFGIILFSLGIIGEYLIRIINATSNEPLFTIRDRKP